MISRSEFHGILYIFMNSTEFRGLSEIRSSTTAKNIRSPVFRWSFAIFNLGWSLEVFQNVLIIFINIWKGLHDLWRCSENVYLSLAILRRPWMNLDHLQNTSDNCLKSLSVFELTPEIFNVIVTHLQLCNHCTLFA